MISIMWWCALIISKGVLLSQSNGQLTLLCELSSPALLSTMVGWKCLCFDYVYIRACLLACALTCRIECPRQPKIDWSNKNRRNIKIIGETPEMAKGSPYLTRPVGPTLSSSVVRQRSAVRRLCGGGPPLFPSNGEPATNFRFVFGRTFPCMASLMPRVIPPSHQSDSLVSIRIDGLWTVPCSSPL